MNGLVGRAVEPAEFGDETLYAMTALDAVRQNLLLHAYDSLGFDSRSLGRARAFRHGATARPGLRRCSRRARPDQAQVSVLSRQGGLREAPRLAGAAGGQVLEAFEAEYFAEDATE